MKDCEEFKQIRENQGFTQVDFAKILGLSRSVVAKIEAGNYKISNRIAEKVISEFPDGVNIIRENYISQRQNHIYKGIVSTRNPVLGKYLEIKVNGEKVNEVKVEDLFFSAQDKEIFEKLISKNQELINVLDSIQDICEMGLLYDNDFSYYVEDFISDEEEMWNAIRTGYSDVIITDSLCFYLEDIAPILHSYGINVRVFPNICQRKLVSLHPPRNYVMV